MAAFAVSALSPVLIPFALDGDGNLNGAGYAAGGMFWLGMIVGIAGYILLYLQYKKKRTEKTKRKLPPPKPPPPDLPPPDLPMESPLRTRHPAAVAIR